MTENQSYHLKVESGDENEEIERLRSQTELSWTKELQLLRFLGLHAQSKVLEIGAGPGFFTEKLLQTFPSMPIISVEPSLPLRNIAHNNVDLQAYQNLQIKEGNVYDLAAFKGTFDFAIARLLFQHLSQPQAAAEEIYRQLPEGGKLAILEIDAGLYGIVSPMNRQLEGIYHKHAVFQAERGGDRLMGRKLYNLLKDTGFQSVELHTFVYHSDELGLAAFAPQISPNRFLPMLAEGKLSLGEWALLQQAYQEFMTQKDAYILMVGFLAIGSK